MDSLRKQNYSLLLKNTQISKRIGISSNKLRLKTKNWLEQTTLRPVSEKPLDKVKALHGDKTLMPLISCKA
jgi:hypothetical protein